MSLLADDEDSEPSSSAEKMIGRVVAGNFRIEALLGSGAMGHVYQAEQLSLGKAVAIKILHPHLQTEDKLIIRFQREAKSASRLNHPNSIQIIDSGRDADGTLFIAMELLKGRDLAQVIRDEFPLPLPRIIRIMTQVFSALEEAHLQGIIHRDLKPSNIMLVEWRGESDFVKVCDFGIAKAQHDTSEAMLTIQGLVCGTPEYMSPEQARAEALDGRADLYSAGVILYQLLAGDIPFRAPTPMGIVSRHLADTPVPPSLRRPDLGIPPALDALVMRAMAKSREQRPPTAAVFRAELLAIGEGRAPASSYAETLVGMPGRTPSSATGATVRMDEPTTETGRSRSSRWWTAAAVAVFMAAASGALAMRLRHGSTMAPPTAEVPRFSGDPAPRSEPSAEGNPHPAEDNVHPVEAAALPVPALPAPDAPAEAPPHAAAPKTEHAGAVKRPKTDAARPGHAVSHAENLGPSAPAPHATAVSAPPPAAVTSPSTGAVAVDPPRTPRDVVQEAERLLGQGSVADACARGEEARRLFPKFAPAYRFLGKCYMRAQRPADAKAAYGTYLELLPGAPDAAFIQEIVRQK